MNDKTRREALRTDQGRWLLDHQGLVNISKPAQHSMRGDEIDLRASVLTIEAEAFAAGRASVEPTPPLDVEAAWPELANIIREVDGNHDLGAGELAARILAHPRFAAILAKASS